MICMILRRLSLNKHDFRRIEPGISFWLNVAANDCHGYEILMVRSVGFRRPSFCGRRKVFRFRAKRNAVGSYDL